LVPVAVHEDFFTSWAFLFGSTLSSLLMASCRPSISGHLCSRYQGASFRVPA
jgi:hypothetical protein